MGESHAPILGQAQQTLNTCPKPVLTFSEQHRAGSAVHQNDRAHFIGRDDPVTHIRKDGSQLLLLLFVLGQRIPQSAGHIVERLAQLTDLVISEHRDLLVKLTFSHRGCPPGQFFDRRSNRMCQNNAKNRGQAKR
ncbi:hypothetical protein D3C81_837700 [compost metagenome]